MHQGLLCGKNSFVAEVTFKGTAMKIEKALIRGCLHV